MMDVRSCRVLILLLRSCLPLTSFIFFFFNDTATTEIYTLSLHDALPISGPRAGRAGRSARARTRTSFDAAAEERPQVEDRKSTRLNSSHGYISYAVFCLKKKKNKNTIIIKLHAAITIIDTRLMYIIICQP